ncbi:ShlB/FhaC/HecB family hemolysin secretion/activation protein [cf. Phormidesmis sp. LEGE 11477]|uniref:ShlB/FhaC/HecB family hemolysin secretion/activation protein n=1 Tax=cf. Phormidesmis sp. LEGE 11477 TaxID=1828680 RepID=UPI001D152050|nr:ShlB/FhaC/HecB family hemolysin secretion/activation protein [cf. Phormidesmis sp. LEGE 11477]
MTLPAQGIAAIESESSTAPVSKQQFLAQVNLPPDLPPGSVPAEPLPPADIDPGSQRDEIFIEPQPLPQLPPVDELLDEPDGTNTPSGLTSGPGETFEVSGIQLEGSTVFSAEDFSTLFEEYIGRPITFDELLQIRSAITQRYIDAGFLTSGAFIPPQTLEEGIVTVQVLEGVIEDIEIVGTRRLNPDYVRSRLGLAAQPPINAGKLLEGLQRLQIDPLIETVSADLQAGVQPGTSILRVDITEAESFGLSVKLDNGRSPNIGSFRRRINLLEGNMFGIGDRATLAYSNTNGSNSLDAGYSIPVSPHNTRITLEGGISESRVIDDTFEALDISSNAFYADIGVTHPLIETPTQELSLGLIFSYKENKTRLGIDNIGPFPLSPGADEDGETRVSALRFSQNWAKRSQRQVLAARSQFNVGGSWLNATNNTDGSPDSQFFSWRGQGQWVRLLGEDALFLLRSDLQLAADSLLLSEQFGLGGQQTVRGYRQDILLRDNGGLLSAEARLPIARFSENSVVQITPFIDAGAAWNHSDNPEGNNVLVGTGVGLLWQRDDNFSARLDWGLPLVDVDSTSDSLQDSGIYFSLQYDLF